MFFKSRFKKYQKELDARFKKLTALQDSSQNPEEIKQAEISVNEYIEGEYAEAVFSYFVRKKPALIRIHTGEEYSWEEAFGESFEKVSKSLRHSLVGLVQGGGRYRIK